MSGTPHKRLSSALHPGLSLLILGVKGLSQACWAEGSKMLKRFDDE